MICGCTAGRLELVETDHAISDFGEIVVLPIILVIEDGRGEAFVTEDGRDEVFGTKA